MTKEEELKSIINKRIGKNEQDELPELSELGLNHEIVETIVDNIYYIDQLKESLDAGTHINYLKFFKRIFEKYKQSENYKQKNFSIELMNPEKLTDENIELFGGMDNVCEFGYRVLEEDMYIKNYKYIKEHYGLMIFLNPGDELILADEYVDILGYENIFKYFNNINSNDMRVFIPKYYTREDMDEIIELYDGIPRFEQFYDPKLKQEIKKAKDQGISVNVNNKWINKHILNEILWNGLEKNIVTILNTDLELFARKKNGEVDFYVHFDEKYIVLYKDCLKIMNSEIYEKLGIENVALMARMNNSQILYEAWKNNLLDRWKEKIEEFEKDNDTSTLLRAKQRKNVDLFETFPIHDIKSILLLDDKNNDLTVKEIKEINSVLWLIDAKDRTKIDVFLKEKPEYIRLLQIPTLLLKHNNHKSYENEFEYMFDESLKIEDVEKKYEEFQQIRNELGYENFVELLSHGGSLVYEKMQQANQNGTLKNWKKILEINKSFIPQIVEILDDNCFNAYSLEDINNINDLYIRKLEMIKQIVNGDYPKFLLYIFSFEELLNQERFIRSYFKNLEIEDVKIIELAQSSSRFKEYLKSLFNTDIDFIENGLVAEMIAKGIKFEELVHFIPALSVIKKYPENQIEKFNKKIWFNLARNQLYNSNNDSKNALVEAILSLGVFENDEGQEERLGLLQKFATYLPKLDITINVEESDEDKLDEEELDEKELDEKEKDKALINEHFEIIEKRLENITYSINIDKLINDPNIMSFFNSKEEAVQELSKLYKFFSNKEDIESEMYARYVNKKYSDIMEYIYRNGYDKTYHYSYVIRLKTDIQQLKIKDKKNGEKTENQIREFYYKHIVKGMMTPTSLHTIFDGMDMVYKEGFFEFLRDNLEQILLNKEKQYEMSKIQRNWDKIVEAYLGQKISFEKCRSYIYNHSYENVKENESEIAKLSALGGYTQEQFEEIQKIFSEQLLRKKSSIPQIENKNSQNGYTYKVLRLDDPITMFVGELTGCCQAIDGAGESCMRHSATSENGRILVVLDEKGKVVSQSWIWRNKNVLCFDNIEAVKKDSENKKIVSSEILDMIKKAAKHFVETDKEQLTRWKAEKEKELDNELKQGKISKEIYDAEIKKIDKIVKGQQLTKVTVGNGYTDVNLKGLKRDNEDRFPLENVSYIDDSRVQFILYEDNTIEHEETKTDMVSIYSDSENTDKLININTSELEEQEDDEIWDDEEDEIGDDEEDEIGDDEEDEIGDDEDDWYEEYEEIETKEPIYFIEEVYEDDESEAKEGNTGVETIQLADIKQTINHVTGRNDARVALENIRRYLVEEIRKEILEEENRNRGV